jgi:hypothetical protein
MLFRQSKKKREKSSKCFQANVSKERGNGEKMKKTHKTASVQLREEKKFGKFIIFFMREQREEKEEEKCD